MRDIIDCTPTWYKWCIIFNAVLVLVSFFMPPAGVVDPSVLTAIGELGGMTFLGMLPGIVKHAKSVKVEKGDTSIEIESKSNN